MRATPIHRSRGSALPRREGFTLLEVLVALVILGFVILSAQASVTSLMVRDVGWQEQRARATQIAMDRLHAIQSDPVYSTLVDGYEEEGTELDRGFTRDTRFQATVFEDGTEYQTVTVTVTGPRLAKPVSRTTVIASP
jgi:prepilin-type N-terminal cleavage/methylation domain-containing protein